MQAIGSSRRMSLKLPFARIRGSDQFSPSSAPRSPTLLAMVKMANASKKVPVPWAWKSRPTASEKANASTALAAFSAAGFQKRCASVKLRSPLLQRTLLLGSLYRSIPRKCLSAA